MAGSLPVGFRRFTLLVFLIATSATAALAKSGKENRLPGEGTWRLRFRTLWAEGEGCGKDYMDVRVSSPSARKGGIARGGGCCPHALCVQSVWDVR